MIGPFFTSEKHSNANEDTHVGEGKELYLHMRPSMYINEPSVSSYEGQACASTIGHCKSHIDAIAPDNADVLPAAEREVPKNSNSCDTEHLLQQLIVDKTMLVDGSPQEPLNAQTDENACADIDAVIDICELIAESQYSSSASPELTRTSDPYKPRSASSHQRFPLEGSGCRGVSFGLKNEPLSIECALQPQPPNKKQNSLSLTSHDDDPDGFKHLPKQESYEFFRTRSGRISRRGSRQEQEQQNQQTGSTPGKKNRSIGKGNVSAGRYFDALRGPELEILKDSEELLLPPEQRWPFLLRFPVVAFGISVGLATQANLWKVVATSPSMTFLHVPLGLNFALWCLALFSLAVILIIYALKCLLYFEAVRREFHHPVRVNFFFAPWIGCMLIAIGIPPSITATVHPSLWCVFVTPMLILELKIYGQWLSGGKRRLSKVANASTHVSLVANFISAILGVQVGWIEPAMFFWAVGCAHYLVLFVTLYQRLPSAEALPKELHPVFFLFIAAPSSACVSWRYIVGDFDQVSKVAYYIGLFLFLSLVVRVKFFCGFRFSIAWWAYTFPMTSLANATVQYSVQVRHILTQVLAITFLAVASLTLWVVFICTILHIMWGSLFPNDIAIAISNQRSRQRHKHHHQISLASPFKRKIADSLAPH